MPSPVLDGERVRLRPVEEADAERRMAYRGLGREATRLVLAHAFDGLGLHRVELRVLAFNAAAIASYQRAGFVIEGRERDSCRLQDSWHDDLMMSILEDEYRTHQRG